MQGTSFAPELYPASALPVLLFTLVCVALSGKVTDAVDNIRFRGSSAPLSWLFGSSPTGLLDRQTEEAVWRRSTRSYTIDSLTRQHRHQRQGPSAALDILLQGRSNLKTKSNERITEASQPRHRGKGKDVPRSSPSRPRQAVTDLNVQPPPSPAPQVSSHGNDDPFLKRQSPTPELDITIDYLRPPPRFEITPVDDGEQMTTDQEEEHRLRRKDMENIRARDYDEFITASPNAARGSNYTFALRRTAEVQSGMNMKLQAYQTFQMSRFDRRTDRRFTPSNFGVRPERRPRSRSQDRDMGRDSHGEQLRS